MRVLIFGATGMLGHKVYQRLRSQFDVYATVRGAFEPIERFGIFEKQSIIENTDVADPLAIRRAVEIARPDCVINAVGIIKQSPTSTDVIQTLTVNSIFPHRLAELSTEYGFRLLTVSTDCVFDGKKGNYSEDDQPNGRDLYGMSKILGEAIDGNSLTIRTSIIGRELSTDHSIVEWFLARRGSSIKGYTNAIYSGFSSPVLADIIFRLITKDFALKGLFHISSDPISKYHLLELLNKHYRARIRIEPCETVVIDRSLNSSKFRKLTGFEPVAWDNMIEQMAADTTPYDSWRTRDLATSNGPSVMSG